MFNESYINRVARQLIHQHGDGSAGRAADMVREQGGIGNQIGAMWAKILARVEDLRWKGYKTSGS